MGTMVLAMLLQAELFERLGADDLETRDDAQVRLVAMGNAVRPAVRRALASAAGERAARLAAVLDRLPKLEAVVSERGPHRVGDALTLDVRLVNVSDEDVWVVQAVPLRCRRSAPDVRLSVRDREGEPPVRKRFSSCIDVPTFRAVDFFRVRPGEEFCPFNRRTYAKRVFDRPGRYEVTFVYDTTGADWLDTCMECGETGEDARELLARVARVRVEAKPLAVDVSE